MYKISCVSYINSLPFLYGLKNHLFQSQISLELDYPSQCAEKLKTNQVDVGLIPVAVLPEISTPHVIGNFCIGADKEVKTVELLFNSHFDEVNTIYLDYQSRTSVALLKIIAKDYWKKNFIFIEAKPDFEKKIYKKNEAILLIGDRVFNYEHLFKNKIDLANEWIKHTKLPFVFAIWTANKKLPEEFISEFNNALQFGISNIHESIDFLKTDKNYLLYLNYLKENISFPIDTLKNEGMNLFLKKLDSIKIL